MSLESVFKLSLVMNMIDNLTGPLGRVTSNVDASVSKLQGFNQALGTAAKTGLVMQQMGAQITGAVLAPVEATFETSRAIGELASLGVRDLGAVEDAARAFSDQWSGTTKADFIAAAYDIKSGIASLSDQGVAEFTSLAALTAKATKASAGEMSSLFATGYGIYKGYYDDLSDLEFGEMFSAGIAQSVKQFKTTGSGMAQSIQTLGGSATTANVPLEEQLSILGMLQATMGGSEAGTKYKAFLRSAVRGGEALGLSFTDANNQLLCMPEILAALRSKFGETMDAAEKMQLQKAFGDTEAVALIDLLYSKTGDLQDNILGMYDALGSGVSVATEMADAINSTQPERYQRIQQRIQNIKESIGNALLPTVDSMIERGEAVTAKVGTWIDKNQELVRVIMLVVLGVGSFLLVTGTLIAVFAATGLILTKTIGAFRMLKAGFLFVRGALMPLIASVWSFTAALLANPVTWVVIGIVALIAALVLLYNKCEWFRDRVDSIIQWGKDKLGAAFGFAKNILASMTRAYEEHGGGLKGIAAAAFEGVKGIFSAGYNVLDSLTGGKLTELNDAVRQKLSGIEATYREHGGGIRGVAAVAMEGVKDAFSAGIDFIDALTGGRLSRIKDAFLGGIQSIRDMVSGAASWFFESGRKIVTTFASGIKSAFTSAFDAVKGGLQRIRNLLPFSDAKEGPLSTLTLSGQRTMTTYAHGLTLAQDAPAEAMELGLKRTKATLEREPAQKISIREQPSREDGEEAPTASETSDGVYIAKLLLNIDFSKIKELPQLINLLKEIEAYTNANGGEVYPTAAPEPV